MRVVPLKALNVLAMAAALVAWQERARPGPRRAALLAGMLLDYAVLAVLLSQRSALAAAAGLTGAHRILHVVASAFVPLFYPFLLLLPPADERTGGEGPGLLGASVAVRGVSFLTSYFMVAG